MPRALAGAWTAALALAALTAEAQPPTPADAFEFRDASLPDTEARMRACIGQPQADVKRTLAAAQSFRGTSETRFTNATAFIVSQVGRWACVPRTAEGRPVWPEEALDNIATIEGVDAQSQHTWRLALLSQLRDTGHALGLIRWPNGNGHEIVIDLQPDSALYAKWSSRFLKADSYDEAAYTAVLSGAGLKSLRSTQLGNGTWHSVVPPRALLWPVELPWAILPGAPATTLDRLSSTTWSRDDTRLRLEADGRATATSQRTRIGTWVVRDGVLRIQWNDNSYETLRLDADGLRLTGVLRRTQPAAGTTPAEEFQAGMAYELVRTAATATGSAIAPAAPATAASAPSVAPPSGTASDASLPSVALARLAALLVYERDLKALTPATGDDTGYLLEPRSRALWTLERARLLLPPPTGIEGLGLVAVLKVQQRLGDEMAPHLRAARRGLRAEPQRFAEVYIDVADLYLRTAAANLRILQKMESASAPGSDASGQRMAALTLMQTVVQSLLEARTGESADLPPTQRERSAQRLRQFQEEFGDTLRPIAP